MIVSNFFDILASCVMSLINTTKPEQSYLDTIKVVTIEEIAQKIVNSELKRGSYQMNTNLNCLHLNPRFQRFLLNRPHFKIKYHRKRSKNYHYVNSTIIR